MIFTGLNPTLGSAKDTSSYNPNVAGLVIEEIFDGVWTLNVSGRRGLDSELKTFKRPLRSGNLLLNKQWPSREIILTLLLRPTKLSNSGGVADEIVGRVSRGGIIPLTFADAFGWTHYGVFAGYSTTEETNSNQMTLLLKFYCPDPYIYKNTVTLPPSKNVAIPTSNVGQPSFPQISFTASATTSTITNPSTGKSIHLTGLTIGNVVVLYLDADEPYPTVNGNVKYTIIDPLFDFAMFDVAPGQSVTSTDTITVKYRERRL